MKIEDLSYEQKDNFANALAANHIGLEKDITELFRYLEQMTEIQLPDYWITEEGKATNPQEERQEELIEELIGMVIEIEKLRIRFLIENLDYSEIKKNAEEYSPKLLDKFHALINSSDPYSDDNEDRITDIANALSVARLGSQREFREILTTLKLITKINLPESWDEYRKNEVAITPRAKREEGLIDILMGYTVAIEQLRLQFLMEINPKELINYDVAHGSRFWERFKELQIDDNGDNFYEFVENLQEF